MLTVTPRWTPVEDVQQTNVTAKKATCLHTVRDREALAAWPITLGLLVHLEKAYLPRKMFPSYSVIPGKSRLQEVLVHIPGFGFHKSSQGPNLLRPNENSEAPVAIPSHSFLYVYVDIDKYSCAFCLILRSISCVHAFCFKIHLYGIYVCV